MLCCWFDSGEHVCSGSPAQARLGLLDDRRRARAIGGVVHRGREGDPESALHELPSCESSAYAGRRSARTRTDDARGPGRPRSSGIAVQVMSWRYERRNARIIDCKHPGSLALGCRSCLYGLARQIAGRNLFAIERWRAKRRPQSCEDPRTHGNRSSCCVGVASGRGTFACARHPGPVRSNHGGLDLYRGTLSTVVME